MRKPGIRRGFPAEAWQVPGQANAATQPRLPQLGEDPKWQQMADQRNAEVEAHYQRMTNPKRRTA